jgi:poly(A) polymerase
MSRINNKNAIEIVTLLKKKGYEAYFVGGCVRDMLLNRQIADIDITTSAHPHQIEKLFPITLNVGAQFGVMVVVIQGVNYEVATFRNDGAYIDGRRPISVEFSTAKEDVLRRDFTINGILYDPIEDKIIDFVNGQEDLKAKTIRAIGNASQRFAEDKLRMLRAVRFTTRLNFSLESETKKAIQQMAADIIQVSQERITDEMEKISTGPSPHKAILLLQETGLLPIILPHFANYQPNAMATITSLFAQMEGCDFDSALAILLAHEGHTSSMMEFDFPSEENPKISEKNLKASRIFNLSNNVTKDVSQIWTTITQFKKYRQLRKALQMRILLNPLFAKALTLQRLWEINRHAPSPITSTLEKDYIELTHQQIPESFLNGTELLALGCQPGHNISLLKTELENQQLEGKITDKTTAIEFVKNANSLK